MRPLLSYFAAQEIPAALVTFVSFLMFLQTGTSPALSTCYSALLSLPWMCKAVMRRCNVSASRTKLFITELFMLSLLLLLAVSLSPNFRLFRILHVGEGNGLVLFGMLLMLAFSVAWHEVLSDKYYHSNLRPALRRFYDAPRMFVSQSMIVVVYGVVIILVGTLQVISRSIYVSWAAGFLLLAGFLALFLILHIILGVFSPSYKPAESVTPAKTSGERNVDARGMWILFLLFLPQALMFYTRVLFLMAPKEDGGMALSLQELGFVHGVIGALAFSIGLLTSRVFVRRRMRSASVGRRKIGYSQYALKSGLITVLGRIDVRMLCTRFLPLLLSPAVYLAMAYCPPSRLWTIAFCTFLAQFMFGYGLHRLLSYLGLPASVGLRVPLVAALMLVPVAASGSLAGLMGFQYYFLMNVLTALLPFAFLSARRGES